MDYYASFKTVREYFKAQWLDSPFNKWQLFHRYIGFAATNSPIESYNNQIKSSFTKRHHFNLVPAFRLFEILIRFESNKTTDYNTEATVTTAVEREAKKLINARHSRDNCMVEVDEFSYQHLGNHKLTYNISLSDKTCTCFQFYDVAMCKHLVAAAILKYVSLRGLATTDRFKIRSRRRGAKNTQVEFDSTMNGDWSLPNKTQSTCSQITSTNPANSTEIVSTVEPNEPNAAQIISSTQVCAKRKYKKKNKTHPTSVRRSDRNKTKAVSINGEVLGRPATHGLALDMN